MSNYDDWKLSNGQDEEKIHGECEYCGNYIYKGADYFKSRIGYFCDSECFLEHCKSIHRGRYEVAE